MSICQKIFHSHHPSLVARYPNHLFHGYVCGPALFDDVDWREVPPLGEQADPFCANNFVFPLSSRLYTANSIPLQLTFRSSMALSQLSRCRRSSGVERTLGKGEAVSSILTGGTIFPARLLPLLTRLSRGAIECHPGIAKLGKRSSAS